MPQNSWQIGHHRSQTAFTLVELLVVIGIIAVLVSILLPTLARARSQANAVLCQARLRDLGTAFSAYLVANKNVGCFGLYTQTPPDTGFTSTSQFWFAKLNNTPATWDFSQGYLTPYFKNPNMLSCPAMPDAVSNTASLANAPSISFGYNTLATSTNTPPKFASIKKPAETMALADSVSISSTILGGFGVSYASVAPTTSSVSSPSFHGRHPGTRGNVLWYDGHVTGEVPYLTPDADMAIIQYVTIFKNKVGFLTPLTPQTLTGPTFKQSARNGYYYWLNKTLGK